MRLGLLSDVHEHVAHLRWAIARLSSEGVDHWVSLGDVTEDGARIEETCELLAGLSLSCVWGNHDYGLCTSPIERLTRHFPRPVIEFMQTFRASLVLEDCHFAHIEPALDANDLGDLWTFPETFGTGPWLERNWAAVPTRRIFMGHAHRWFAASEHGPLDWQGQEPLQTSGALRFFIVVAAVRDGCCAWLDTETGELRAFSRDRAD